MKLKPEFSAFEKTHAKGQGQVVYATLPADHETPVSALLALKEEGFSALFESVQGGENRGRYSFLCLKPDLIWKSNGEVCELAADAKNFKKQSAKPFEALRKLVAETKLEIPLGLPPMAAGLFGYMSYDMVRQMERLPDNNKDVIGIPESLFVRPQIIVIFDSVKDDIILVTPVYPREKESAKAAYERAQSLINEVIEKLNKPRKGVRYRTDVAEKPALNPLELKSSTGRDGYHKMVKKAVDYILAGDIFQVVPSQRFEVPCPHPATALYRALRHLNPSPFLFYFDWGQAALVGSSPEILVRLRDGKVTIRPIAGTRKRGKTTEEDIALEKDLLSDQKEISEHLMLLDLGRNDVGRVAKPGTVKVTEHMKIERYSHVMHIVSNVEGEVAPGKDALDALIAGFPAGTVSGAPKIRAMEIIDELEPVRRSFYGGCVGYISANGSMDTCIALRTGLVKDGTLYVQAGGGVVAESDPEAEYQESCNKAGALLKALQEVEGFL